VMSALASSGESARPALTRVARGAFTRLNGFDAISPIFTASVNACRHTFRQFSTVYGAYLSSRRDCQLVRVSGPATVTG